MYLNAPSHTVQGEILAGGNFRENTILRQFKFSGFYFSRSVQCLTTNYSYWYDTPLARERVRRVRVKETMADRASFSAEAMVRGYHAYKDIWTAVNSKELPCQGEDGHRVYAFAVAIMKDGTVADHFRGTNWPGD